jgi:hypothetical protein
MQMSTEEIVSEIGAIRQDLQVKFARVQGLAQGLYHRVRREPPDDNTSVYLTYANAWMRFAGMATQGVTRTVSASRVLRRLTPVANEDAPTPRKQAVKAKEATAPIEDLISMYGGDVSDPVEVPDAPTSEASMDESED